MLDWTAVMERVNLAEKFKKFNEYWSPKIVGQLNDSHVKIAKLKGEFVWHNHAEEDELFLVIKGHLVIKLRDNTGGARLRAQRAGESASCVKETEIHLDEGEFAIVPRGIEHLPVTEEEVHVLLIEPKSALNTGNVTDDRTVPNPEWI
jgi:mannose-6-phosphate isomerase-like protein (cupin superfamily)